MTDLQMWDYDLRLARENFTNAEVEFASDPSPTNRRRLNRRRQQWQEIRADYVAWRDSKKQK